MRIKLKADYERHCPIFDQPPPAFLTDLNQRGLLDDVLVIWCTELGRMPTPFEMANAFAFRLLDKDVVASAHALAFQRRPIPSEHEAAEKFVGAHGLAEVCRAILNSNQPIYLE